MVPETAIAIIKEFEGLRLEAYLCPAGVWTIGYGCTRINGRPVKKGDKLASEAEADRLLRQQIETDYLPKLRGIPFWEEITPNQHAALISFAWNLGASFYGSSGFNTLSKRLREKDWQKVPEALLLYDKANGKPLLGLTRRRQKEAELWRSPSPSPSPKNIQITEETTMPANYWFLDFCLALDSDNRLEHGRLALRSVGVEGGRTHQVWVATTSLGTKQVEEGFHARGGPIPPEYRVPSLRCWWVETAPVNLINVKGVEGNFYKILPFEIKTDKGGVRSDLGIHRDANTPGSMGCIVMNGDRFKHFEEEMLKLQQLKISSLPLFVTYPTD